MCTHSVYFQYSSKHGVLFMKTRAKIQKWGNSLGIRITGAMKTVPHFEENMIVTVEITAKGIFIYPVFKKKKEKLFPFTEAELLSDLDAESAKDDMELLPKILPKEYDL